jgi:hypothetical protein
MSSMVPFFLGLLLSAPSPIIETKPAVFHPGRPKAVATPPTDLLVRSAARLPEAARHDLAELSTAEEARLLEKDTRVGKTRRKAPAEKIGIVRDLSERVGFSGMPNDLLPGASRTASGGLFERTADGWLAWTAGFSSAGAGGVRLHVAEASLPPGARVWAYSLAGEVFGPYGPDRVNRPGGFWTNTVYAPEIFLRVELPAAGADTAAARLAVSGIGHIEAAFAPGTGRSGSARWKSETCFVDEACVTTAEFPNVALASDAIAQLTFEDGGSFFVCTGGLLNSTDQSFVPYLLTANHCFSDQAAAQSLEAVWRYVRPSCNGPEPPPFGFPRTLGSTLRATSATSDFTLVELDEDPPPGSVFLGWTTADVTLDDDMLLYRLHHPNGRPQFFTKEQVTATVTPFVCFEFPQGPFLYQRDIVGGTAGGSSGSPLYLQSLQVVGQLGGACGNNTSDFCASQDFSSVDGAFHTSFPALQPFIAPGFPGACTPNATTLCLNGGRFRVTVDWAKNDGDSGPGQGVALTSDSGYFWFFNADNIEMVVKVLQACSLSQHFWVFAGGLTNVDVVMTVTDTQTGAERVYTNPLGTAFVPLQDTSAFTCP